MAKRRSRKGSYKLTARRRVALKKAQTVSAQKRLRQPNKNSSGRRMNSSAMGGKRKSNLSRNIALTTVGVGAISAAGIVARHKLSGSSFSKTSHGVVGITGNVIAPHGHRLSHSKLTTRGIPGNQGREFRLTTAKRGPLGNSSTFGYTHKPLTRQDVLGKVLKSKKTAQPWFENTVSAYNPDRGHSKVADPDNPGFNIHGQPLATSGNFGSYGKRMAVNGPRKFIGTYEMFSNIGESGKIKGYTSIGEVITAKKNK